MASAGVAMLGIRRLQPMPPPIPSWLPHPRALATGATLSITALGLAGLSAAPAAQADSNLAILLQASDARLIGLYDGVRFVQVKTHNGTRVTVTLQCETQRWRVARIEPKNGRADFRDDAFESAPGIGRSNWCTQPVRTLE